MTRVFAIASLLLTVAVGCDELPTGDCDTSAYSSVTVSIVDSGGSLTSADDVTYAVDGGAEASCEALDSFGEEWVCGYEETGNFEIFAYVGGSVYTGTATVGMGADGCHVNSQFLDITVP